VEEFREEARATKIDLKQYILASSAFMSHQHRISASYHFVPFFPLALISFLDSLSFSNYLLITSAYPYFLLLPSSLSSHLSSSLSLSPFHPLLPHPSALSSFRSLMLPPALFSPRGCRRVSGARLGIFRDNIGRWCLGVSFGLW